MPDREYFEAKTRDYQRLLCGERYVGVSISQILAPNWAQLKILDWINNPKNFLVYLGNPGIGKTFLCAALIPWAMKKFISFRYFNDRNLLTKVRESIDTGGDCLRELQLLLDDPLVIIDDLGSSGLNDWRKDILFETIDLRYNSMKPTVITSNFTKDEFTKHFHPRFCSRLFAKENTIIELDKAPDLRIN